MVGRWPSRDLCAALLYAAFLAGYGNVFNLLVARAPTHRRTMLGVAGPLMLVATVLAWHRRGAQPAWAGLGLHRQRWRSGLVWGALAGTALAVPPVLFFRPSHRKGAAVRFNEVHGIGRRALLHRLLVTTPVLVAFAEEVAFRGFLQSKLQQALPTRPLVAVTLSSLTFALWHVAVNVRTLRETNVVTGGLAPQPVALAGGLLSVFAGGLIFGGLYQRSGSLVGPVMSHWLVDALMLLALYFQSAE
ncbi:MAG: lysostaphin resistance A-like protein [Chloroflexota bacterium]